ncbi:hypothetical protein ACJMK2_044672 [Sinanodonta woodiana]|uniref:C-type lectin domain-containing protein n=1 Tax=Sinanodonta woodiana TaxID=1069815 RepID=A0ABD3W0S6_SINWO
MKNKGRYTDHMSIHSKFVSNQNKNLNVTGVFKWKMTQSIPIASLWGSGEPNIKNPDESVCVRYKPMKGFQLADFPCSDVYTVICERPTVHNQGSSSVATKQVSPTTIPKSTPSQTTIINMTTISSLEKLLVEMKINDNSTSRYIRTKTCAEDKRISSKVVGLIGTVILAVVFTLPVASDALNLILFLTK